jgi:hypothetical protein
MALDWSQCPTAESVAGKLGVAWVFRGTNLEQGLTVGEIVEMFDGLSYEQVKAVLDFTTQSLEPSPLPQ